MPTKPPTGTVTFLFTDIVGSTEMWEEHGDTFLPVLQAHNAILSEAIANNGGYLMKTEGDSYKVAFADPAAAVRCALVAQAGLQRYPWPQDVGPLRVRMAVHTGHPFFQAGDYLGPPLNRTARILSATHGGQVLVSDDTLNLVENRVDSSVAFRDQGYHALRDLDEPIRLYQAEHPAIPQRHFPPPRSLNGHAHNLPRQRRSFIGREKEIEQIAGRLTRGDTRLLTLTGPEGIGKTRLSVQVAAEYTEWFPDGTWIVSLDRACDVEAAGQQVAETLGIPVPEAGSAVPGVRDWLADRHCLLILDDCGHVPEAGQLIRELLSGAPSLRCLATSRQSLPGAEEVAVELPGLSLPDEGARAKEVLASESGQHFAERVLEGRPDFELTDSRAPTIARLLHKLEGVPASNEKAAELLRASEVTAGRILDALGPDVRQGAEQVGRAAMARGRELFGKLRQSPGLASLLQSVASVAVGRSDLDEAERKCRDALDIFHRTGDRPGIAAALRQLGNLAYIRKDYARAVTLLSAAYQESADMASPVADAVLADLQCARRAAGAAADASPVSLQHALALALDAA